MCLNILSKQINALPQTLLQGAEEIGSSMIGTMQSTVSTVARTFVNPSSADMALRLVADTVLFWDLQTKTEMVARPIITTFTLIRNTIDASRIGFSINHIVNGTFYTDIVEKKIVPLITEVAFLFGRTMATLNWCADQKIINWEDLAKKALSTGGVCAYYAVNMLRMTKLMDALFIVALSGLIYQDAEFIWKGEDMPFHILSSLSSLADVISITIGFTGFGNPYVATSLGIIAATTGLMAWYHDPANNL